MLFMILFLPLTLLAAHFSPINSAQLLDSGLLMCVIALVSYLLFVMSSPKYYARYMAIYYCLFFLLVGVLPILYYLLLEIYRLPAEFLIRINPFWLIWQMPQAEIFYNGWLLQCLGWLGIVAIIFIIKRWMPDKTPD